MLGARQKSYLLGEFEFSPLTVKLTRDGVPVHLPHKPFQVLHYLIEHRERVVSRQELLERFWDGHNVYDETLTKSIGAIRKALADTSDSPRFVATLWAEGYRYIGPCAERLYESMPGGQLIEETRAVRVLIREDDQPGITVEKTISSPVTGSKRLIHKRFAKAAVLVGGALVILALGGLVSLRRPEGSVNSVSKPIRSIAVLPLKNLTNDRAQEYFTDGMTESFISALSRIDGLKVISRSSVFVFKGKEVDPRDVGDRLGVEGIIEGSIRQEGDTLRVAVQLVSASDGRVIWANETYKRETHDIFSLQDEIARDVAEGLKITLSAEGIERLEKRGTRDVEAYRLYLKGRHFWNKRTGEGLEKAIECFRQATERDPAYAQAYAGLADSYALLSYFSELPENETFPKAKIAAQQALKLDDSLAEAHASLGLIAVWYELNWAGAEKEYEKAIFINPNYATAHQWYGNLLTLMGRYEEGVNQLRRAQEQDPLSLVISTDLGMALFFAQNYDQASTELNKVLELDANFTPAHYFVGWIHERRGEFASAIKEFQKAVELSQGSALFLAMLGHSYAVSGQPGKARQVLSQLREIRRHKTISLTNEAIVLLGLDEREEALRLLEQACQDKDVQLAPLKVNPIYESIRSDSRFQNILQRVGLASS